MPADPPPTGSRPRGLTTRAAVLGLVFCALVVSAALPLREYLAQRGQIAAARAQQEQARARVKALEDRLRQLQDPAYVRAQARARLHYVLPGETAYVLSTPRPGPTPTGASVLTGMTASGPEAPWYSQLWSSVRVADQPDPARPRQGAPRSSPSPRATPSP